VTTVTVFWGSCRFLNFGQADQKTLGAISVEEAKCFIAEGHFAAGSMLPKVEAALDFIERGGETVIITSPHKLKEALKGKAGTRIYRDGT
jgi:carbamate kinase